MLYCSKCELEVNDDAKFCTNCGEKIISGLQVTNSEKISLFENNYKIPRNFTKKKKTKMVIFIVFFIVLSLVIAFLKKDIYIKINPFN